MFLSSMFLNNYYVSLYRASDISRKKAKFRRIFRGKFAEKSANFVGFSQEKSQNLRNNWPILRDFGGKKSIFEGFPGANSYENRPISREISGGKLRQETISKKQPIFLVFFLANFAKIDQFCVGMTSIGERFF